MPAHNNQMNQNPISSVYQDLQYNTFLTDYPIHKTKSPPKIRRTFLLQKPTLMRLLNFVHEL